MITSTVPKRRCSAAISCVTPAVFCGEVTLDDPLNTAYARMKLYDVSQLPVIDAERVVGIVDESDLLLAVLSNPSRFDVAVRYAMSSAIETIQVDAPLSDLLPVFDKGYVAVVVDGERFLGLITRIDLVNHLRRQVD